MIRVGLSGGIGAGKSTVARTLTERGAYLIDSDVIAREVVAPGSDGLAELVEAFGDDIVDGDGALDRPALAAKAFADDEQRARLNAITHPRVGTRTWELLSAAPDDAIVLQDIPLLVENNMTAFFHLIVIAHADEDLRLARLTGLRGMDADDARARIRAQATDDQRREVADVWLDNSGDQDALVRAAERLWDERLIPFEANVRSGGRSDRGPIHLVPADPDWSRQGRQLVRRLRGLAGAAAVRVDHIGSTAVRGLDAKDVIDLQITVRDDAAADSLDSVLTDGGFPRVREIESDLPKPGVSGETDASSWRKRLHGSADPGRPANVHIRVEKRPNQLFALQFRDLLIADASFRAQYLAAKRAAAASADGDAATYADAKEPFFDAAFSQVTAWAAETGWEPDEG